MGVVCKPGQVCHPCLLLVVLFQAGLEVINDVLKLGTRGDNQRRSVVLILVDIIVAKSEV